MKLTDYYDATDLSSPTKSSFRKNTRYQHHKSGSATNLYNVDNRRTRPGHFMKL